MSRRWCHSRPARAHGRGEAGPVEDLAVRRSRNVVRGDGGPDAGTLVRPLVVEDGRRAPQAANAGWPDIEVTHENETRILGRRCWAGRRSEAGLG